MWGGRYGDVGEGGMVIYGGSVVIYVGSEVW